MALRRDNVWQSYGQNQQAFREFQSYPFGRMSQLDRYGVLSMEVPGAGRTANRSNPAYPDPIGKLLRGAWG